MKIWITAVLAAGLMAGCSIQPATPLLEQGVVYVRGTETITAIDQESGRVLWHHNVSELPPTP